MKKQRLSAVVFDCDGVLIESNAIKTQAFGQTVKEFGLKAMERLMDYHEENGGISRFKKFEWFYETVVKAPLTDDMMESLCSRFKKLCIDAVIEAPMVAGAQSSLDLLSGKIPLFVASGTPEKELQEVLEKRELTSYFKTICGTPPEKNYLLQQIIVENNLDASTVLMVGDAVTDLKAAEFNHSLFYGRGDLFSNDNVPWSNDLVGLIDYITLHFDLDSRI